MSTIPYESSKLYGSSSILSDRRSTLIFIATFAIWTTAFYFIEHDWNIAVTLQLEGSEFGELKQLHELVESGSLQRQLAFPIVGLTGLILWAIRVRSDRSRFSANFWMFAVFVAWTFASCLWSADLGLTTRRLVVFGCVVLGAVAFQQHFTGRQAEILVICVAVTHLLIGITAEAAHGRLFSLGGDYRFAGTLHPNTQAVQLGAAGLAILCIMQQSRQKWLLGGAFLGILALVVMTRSRTALGSFLLASTVVGFPQIPRRLRCLSFLLPASILMLTIVTILVLDLRVAQKLESIIFLGRIEEIGTFTGRTRIWQAILDHFWQSPAVGFGYGAYWTPETLLDLEQKINFQPAHAHSAYLQAMLDVGLIGFSLMAIAAVIAVVQAFRAAVSEPQNVHARFFLALFVFGACYSLLDTTFMIPGFINAVTFAGLMSTFGRPPAHTFGRREDWKQSQEQDDLTTPFRDSSHRTEERIESREPWTLDESSKHRWHATSNRDVEP
jgi:O-antigen ligase